MGSNRVLLATVLLGLAAGASAADEIYRCKSPGGSVSYQQQPCDNPGDGGAAGIATLYPDHTAERNRLAQREAAMDARLMRRLEIESSERIARDDRIAREATLQAEREAALNTPVYAIGWNPRHRMMGQRRAWPTITR